MKEKKLYKIRRILDGQFAKGGNRFHISWSENGKVWLGLGPLRNHITMITESWEKLNENSKIVYPHPYENCEVLEIEMVVRELIPAMEEVIGVFERRKEKEAKRKTFQFH